jgi:hypothetical protein
MGKLSNQLCKACKENKTIPICFVGSFVGKSYAILFSNFWLLFITSFIPNVVEDDDAAKTIYQYVMIVSVVVGLSVMPFIGKWCD